MLGLVMALLSAVAALGIYLDASHHHIGKDPVRKPFWEPSAGEWGVWGLFFWPLAVPIYLIKRKSLIEKARTRPVVPKNRTRSIVLLSILGLALVGYNVSFVSNGGDLPSCDSPEATALVRQIIDKMPTFEFSSPAQDAYDGNRKIRYCTGILSATHDGNDAHAPFRYTVSWHNEEKGEYRVDLIRAD